jgi:hypothetical protein
VSRQRTKGRGKKGGGAPAKILRKMARDLRLRAQHGRAYEPSELAALDAGARAIETLKEAVDYLYPPADPDEQWSPDTIEHVAAILTRKGTS